MPLSPAVRRERRAQQKRLQDPPPRRFFYCQNCGKRQPQNQRRGNYVKKFCNDECRNEFHKHGSAFGPLKGRLETLVKRWTRDMEKRLMARIEERREQVLLALQGAMEPQGRLMRELRESIESQRKDIAYLNSELARLDSDLTALENR